MSRSLPILSGPILASLLARIVLGTHLQVRPQTAAVGRDTEMRSRTPLSGALWRVLITGYWEFRRKDYSLVRTETAFDPKRGRFALVFCICSMPAAIAVVASPARRMQADRMFASQNPLDGILRIPAASGTTARTGPKKRPIKTLLPPCLEKKVMPRAMRCSPFT